jgi:TatA/E family protein of Tat protein translocase
MFGPIGVWEMVIILIIALIVFGPRKLPELGRSLGKSLREFKSASNELRNTLDDEIRVEERRPPKATAPKTDPAAPPPSGEAQGATETEAAGSSISTASPEPVAVAAPTPEPHPTEPGAGA